MVFVKAVDKKVALKCKLCSMRYMLKQKVTEINVFKEGFRYEYVVCRVDKGSQSTSQIFLQFCEHRHAKYTQSPNATL